MMNKLKEIFKKGHNPVMLFRELKINIEKRIERIKDRYPVFIRYPFLSYVVAPLVLALFIKARYLLEFCFVVFVTWIIDLLTKTYGITISYYAIAVPVILIILIIRLSVRIKRRAKKYL